MKAPGKLVTVSNTHIHVYCPSESSSHKGGRIVFLAGLGTECPTYDFKPLGYLLMSRFHVVIVERPAD